MQTAAAGRTYPPPMLLPNTYDLVWSLGLLASALVVPLLVAVVGYWVVRLAVRHELRRAAWRAGADAGPAAVRQR